jgi:uncharacterized membrane protein SpoIIM required for sporulation/ABC-type transport system involved in multi-copper enzyme maturation permease subunit
VSYRALVITRREIRDSLRDWRIVAPIALLTLGFPVLMNFTARVAENFVRQYGAQIITTRLIPFGLMVVGFFPISFSLVIALETFVGEKERYSLEPLLSTPVSDAELYVGKLLAAVLLPLIASYVGMALYLLSVMRDLNYSLPPLLLVQIFLLTAMEGLVMVAGAVVVSSHTTSVRAANLLASFIIVPMALFVQSVSVLMFWGRFDMLWYVILILAVADVALVRAGVRTFNREEILSRGMDELNVGRVVRLFGAFLREGAAVGYGASGERASWWRRLARLYRYELPRLLWTERRSLMVATLMLVVGVAIGVWYAWRYPFPASVISLEHITEGVKQAQGTRGFPGWGWLPVFSAPAIFVHNMRVLLLGALLAPLSFGALTLVLLLAPMTIVGFLGAEVAIVGGNPWVFLAAFILPHGWVELPAAVLATGFAVRLGAVLMAPPTDLTAGEALVKAAADFVKVFILLVLPMLVVAALLESYVTPQVVLWVYGG